MERVAIEWASKVVITAIESQSVKLQGPGTDVADSKRAAEADATYILTLLTRLTEGPPKS